MGTSDKLTDLRSRRAKIEKCGGNEKISKQHEAKKLTARERILYLFDEGSFVEVGAFVTNRNKEYNLSDIDAPADGVVCGYGTVDGRLVYAYSQDFTVIGGAMGEMQAKKICGILDMAMKMGAPVVALSDSKGARIQEGMSALAGYGEIMAKTVMASGVIPQITAVMGPCAGSAAIVPALGDFVFMVQDTAQMYMNGPSVIGSISGKNITEEDMASTKVCSEIAGEVHFTAQNDRECIDKIRILLSYLPSNNLEDTPFKDGGDDINRISQALMSIVPEDGNSSYDVKNVISEIVDNGIFTEVKSDYAKNIVCGFARMNGSTVGIVANQSMEENGILDIKALDKAAEFVAFCDSFNISLVTLTDCEGFKAKLCQEQRGIAKHSAKLMYAYAEATVPKINVIIGKAYGGAYLAMSSKQLGADIVYAWHTAEISVMNPEGAARLIFADDIAQSEDPLKENVEKLAEYKEKHASPYEAARLALVDDIIEPDSTRPRIIAALEMLASKRETRPGKKHGNMPV